MRKYVKVAKEAIRGKARVMERPEKMNTPAAPDGKDSPYRVSEAQALAAEPYLALLEKSLRDAREMFWDRLKIYGYEHEVAVGLELYRARRMDMFGRTLCEVLATIIAEADEIRPPRRKPKGGRRS